jgi:hypothetical protein
LKILGIPCNVGIFWNLESGNMYSRLIPVVFEALESNFQIPETIGINLESKFQCSRFQIPVKFSLETGISHH